MTQFNLKKGLNADLHAGTEGKFFLFMQCLHADVYMPVWEISCKMFRNRKQLKIALERFSTRA